MSITPTLRADDAPIRVARLACRLLGASLCAAYFKHWGAKLPKCAHTPLAALLAAAIFLVASPIGQCADIPLPGLHWFAPVLSGGGYCSEANALLHGLKSLPPGEAPPLRVTHHGDAVDYLFYRGLPQDYARELNAMLMARRPKARNSVIVCHSEPGAWSPAKYETARCPPEGYGRDNARPWTSNGSIR